MEVARRNLMPGMKKKKPNKKTSPSKSKKKPAKRTYGSRY
tara:strand:- start:729 stop:848 length:120 start_codon:yes stop_codon:yes gene_type:complete